MLQGRGIEVVGPVYPDESMEETPSVHRVLSLVRQGGPHSEGRDHIERPTAGGETGCVSDWLAHLPIDTCTIDSS